MKSIVAGIALTVLLTSCETPNKNAYATLWNTVQASDVCMPSGHLWSAREMDVTDADHQMTYEAIYTFKNQPKKDTIHFLLTRLNSTQSTSVHVCPFQVATEGELAVYMLELITGRAWHIAINLKERPDNPQGTLRTALLDSKNQILLQHYFKNEVLPE